MKTLFFIVAAVFSVSARAETIQTNYTLTPKASQFDLRGAAAIGRAKTEFPQSNYAVTTHISNLEGSAFYGLTDSLAIGIGINYSDYKSEGGGSILRVKGMGSLDLGSRSNIDLGGITLYLAPSLKVDLEDAQKNNDTNIYTAANGQNVLSLEAAAITQIDIIKLAAIWVYDKSFNGKQENINSGSSTTDTLSQGDSMKVGAMVELEHAFHPSFRVRRIMNYQTKSVSGNNTSYTSTLNYTDLNLTARLDLSEALQVLPSLSFYRSDKQDDDSQVRGWELGAMVRYLF